MTGLRRHVPELAVEWLMDAPEERWRCVHGTLCFADISGFTALAERLAQRGRIGGEELVETLGRVFANMLDIAAQRGGGLLKFGGDALLLFFQGDGHAVRAASAAVEMRQALRRAAEIPTSVGPLRLSMSVGLHSGAAHFFLVGSTHRELVLLGPAANLVVATESAANAGEILVSAATAAALPKTAIKPRSDGSQLVRWRRAPFEPNGRAEPRAIAPSLVADLFPRKLGAYLALGAPDPEHRVACIAFIRFSGTDAILANEGAEALANALHRTVSAVQAHLDEADVTLLAIDIDRDGGKFFIGAGVPYGHEDDEGAMLRALRRIADSRLPLPLQIGVNRGHVFAAEVGGTARAAYSAMGDTTNTAARIASKTPIGSIFAHPSVLDQSLTLYAVRPAEALVLKGKKAPLVVYEVGDEIGLRQREGLTVDAFIGRQTELQTVESAVAALAAGTGSVIRVVGGAGLGKSRLLQVAVAGLETSAVLSVRAEPYGTSSPYRMFRDPLRALMGIDRADPTVMHAALSRRVEQADPALMPYLALLGEVLQIPVEPSADVRAIDPRFRQERIADALIRVLETSRTGPLVIVVDDAHWCDEASSHLLSRLARACADKPWLLVVARRDDPGGFEHEAQHEIRLGPMDAKTIKALVVAATEAAPFRPHEIDIIVGRASGNPLFATEIVRAAREVGSLDAVPQSLEATLAARIDALEPAARRVLRYASALGRSFSTHVLAHILEAEGHGADLAALTRLDDFLDADGDARLRFRSGLVRDTSYEGVAYRLRARLHRVAGTAIEELADDPTTVADSLALHFLRAGEFASAWRYARIAADRARQAYANADATRLYEMALDAARRVPDVSTGDRVAVLTDLGDVREMAGLFDDALDAYRRAARLLDNDPVARAELLLRSARARERAGAFSAALRDLSTGRRMIAALNSAVAAQATARLDSFTAVVLWAQDRPRPALRQAELAVAAARGAGEQVALGRALSVLELAHLALEGPGDGRYLRESLAIFEALGDIRNQAIARANLGFLCAHAGRWDEAGEWFITARDQFLRCGDAVGAAFPAMNFGEMLVKQRRFDEAEVVLTDALRVMRASDFSEGVASAEVQLAQILIERGALEAADTMLARVIADFMRIGQSVAALEASIVRGTGRVRAGDPGSTLDLLDRASAAAGTEGNIFRPVLALTRATALAALGRREEAEQEVRVGLAAARDQSLPYEEAMLVLAGAEIAANGSDTRKSYDAARAQEVLVSLGVRGTPRLTS